MPTTNEIFRLVFSGDLKNLTSAMTKGEADMKASVRKIAGALAGASAAISAAGFKAGADWDQATKTIVAGTGATGEALAGLQKDYQAVARYGPNAATAVADFNTHLGLQGEELQRVAAAMLKAEVDTNRFGSVAKQMGLDASGTTQLLDDLTVVSQATGVSVDDLTKHIGNNSARFQAAGGSVQELTDYVVDAAYEFGPAGLRGAMSETMEEVDKGVIPATTNLRDRLGDTTGAVERTYEAGLNWRDVIKEMGTSAMASIGPHGDLVGALGSVATTAMGFLTAFPGAAVAVGGAAKTMWTALGGPIGLIVAGIGALGAAWLLWGDEITAFLSGAWNSFVGVIEGALDWLRPFADYIGIELPDDLGSWKVATEAATTANEAAAPAVAELDAANAALATTTTASVVPAVSAAKEEIEAFDLSTFNAHEKVDLIGNSLGTTKVKFEDLLTPVGDMTLAFGFFADELAADGGPTMAVGDLLDGMLEAPRTAEQVADDLRLLAPTWGQNLISGLGSTFSVENVSATLSNAFTGGGGWSGAAKALGAQAGGVIGGAIREKLGGLIGSILPPGLAAAAGPAVQAAMALGKKIWSGIKGMFGGGTNEAEDAYQSVVDASMAAAATDIELERRTTEAAKQGHDERAASVLAMFRRVSEAQGQTIAEADALFERFHHAQADSASAAEKAWAESYASQIQEQYAALEVTTETATATAEKWAESFGAQTVASTEMTDQAIANTYRLRDALVESTGSMLSSWQTMVDGMEASWRRVSALRLGGSGYTAGTGSPGASAPTAPGVTVMQGGPTVVRAELEGQPVLDMVIDRMQERLDARGLA